MSKSVGNVIEPAEIIDQYGADILRLWVASSDFKGDVSLSDNILSENAEVYRRIRNTARYILGNLSDFDPETDQVADESLTEIDQWALMKLQEVVQEANQAYDNYEYHRVYHAVHNFCAVEMSSFYMDVSKDRLYTLLPDDQVRRSAQTAMYKILMTLTKLIAPILVHTAEEIWQEFPAEYAESIFLTDWPEVEKQYLDDELAAKWDRLREIRKDVSKALELAREEDIVGHSLDAEVKLYPTEKVVDFLEQFDDLAELFITSRVEVASPEAKADEENVYAGQNTEIEVAVGPAAGEKCDRCWHYSPTVGQAEEHPDLCSDCLEVVTQL